MIGFKLFKLETWPNVNFQVNAIQTSLMTGSQVKAQQQIMYAPCFHAGKVLKMTHSLTKLSLIYSILNHQNQ